MQSQDKNRIAVLSAYALALHGFESLIPMPLPWLRVGLANIITLITLMLLGFRAAMIVTLIRVTLGSLFTGSFLGPGFILSLGGGLAGTLSIGLMVALSPGMFGPVGLSMIAALFHNLVQLFLAYLLFVQNLEPVLLAAPVLILIGTATGLVNGIVSDLFMKSLKKSGHTLQNTSA